MILQAICRQTTARSCNRSEQSSIGCRWGFNISPGEFVEGQVSCHISVMTTQPAVQPITPIYRLIVTPSPLKAKQFVWVIVDDSNRSAPVQTSKQTFRSLEDAYNAGK